MRDSRWVYQAVLFMTIAAPPPGLQPEDYDKIAAAVMETARGRWFLAEYARRVRVEEDARVLAAIERLEARLEAQRALAPLEAFTLADRLMELSWSLREGGVEDFVCGKIETLSREIKGAGEFAGRGASAPVEDAPRREAPAVEPASPAVESLEPPACATQAPIAQNETGRECVLEAREARAPEPVAEPAIDPRLPPLSWLDSLPLVDRLALFS
ncbi:MAG: hypothetical protein CTY15_05430 [Methylocystis sp.]|nr:MAG: hypothetical protein CTY15_05430 [Methylocystis sp.]